MKKKVEPVKLFSKAERQAALADIVRFILNRRKLRQDQAKQQTEPEQERIEK